MKIKKLTKDQVKEKLTGEELLSFVDDIDKLTRGQRKNLITMAFLMMQLKRCTRDELKDIIGYTMKLNE